MATQPIMFRIPSEAANALDEAVTVGAFASRPDLVLYYSRFWICEIEKRFSEYCRDPENPDRKGSIIALMEVFRADMEYLRSSEGPPVQIALRIPEGFIERIENSAVSTGLFSNLRDFLKCMASDAIVQTLVLDQIDSPSFEKESIRIFLEANRDAISQRLHKAYLEMTGTQVNHSVGSPIHNGSSE